MPRGKGPTLNSTSTTLHRFTQPLPVQVGSRACGQRAIDQRFWLLLNQTEVLSLPARQQSRHSDTAGGKGGTALIVGPSQEHGQLVFPGSEKGNMWDAGYMTFLCLVAMREQGDISGILIIRLLVWWRFGFCVPVFGMQLLSSTWIGGDEGLSFCRTTQGYMSYG